MCFSGFEAFNSYDSILNLEMTGYSDKYIGHEYSSFENRWGVCFFLLEIAG